MRITATLSYLSAMRCNFIVRSDLVRILQVWIVYQQLSPSMTSVHKSH